MYRPVFARYCSSQFTLITVAAAARGEGRVFFTLCEGKMTSRKQDQRSSNSNGTGRSKEDCNFNETDRSIPYEINNSMKEMKNEMLALKLELNETKLELSHVKCENEKLKQAINLNIFKIDELEQCGRRENLRIHGVPESNSKADDGEWVPFKIAEELDQGGPNPGPRATCGPRQHFLWPAENSAKNSGETARKSQ